MFEPIQRSMGKKERGGSGVLFSARVCFEAEELIKKLLPNAKNKFKIISFKDGRLKIGADGSIILHQIKMQEEEIKKGLKEEVKIKSLIITYLPQG